MGIAARYHDGLLADVQPVELEYAAETLVIRRAGDMAVLARWPARELYSVHSRRNELRLGANGLPADVQRFIEQREGCEHWAGEPDYDEARRKQIEEAVRELCPGVDTQLAKLRKTYADNPRVMAALADFEPLGMDE